MKNFLYSFLGTLAGIWVSVILGGILLVLTIIALFVNINPDVKVNDHSILRISLNGVVVDREEELTLMDVMQGNTGDIISLSRIVRAIEYARDDKRIDGIYLECNGASIGLAQAQSLIDALDSFKESGKWVVAYADNYDQANYFVATAADKVILNPIGMVDIHGLSAKTFYLKDLLDKIGLDMQVVKVGTYKSAVEPLLMSEMSEANREQQVHFLGNIWDQYTSDVAGRRGLHADSLKSWASSFYFTQKADRYMADGIVDSLMYHRQVDEMMARMSGEDEPKFVDFADYCTEASHKFSDKYDDCKYEVAVLYALGDITENEEGGIASQRLVPQILELADDDDIDGLILRVNSGGGSAFASEQIWEALEQYKAKTGKPFFVSMSDMAASGGYYISCGADKIYAEPMTLTGSIGIFGVIPNFQPLMKDKLGVNVVTVQTNQGGFPDVWEPMTPEQRTAMQSYVNRGYELFTSRCAAGRGVPVDSIYKVAEGRVWDGISAKRLGLVDELGGLEDAIAGMAEKLSATRSDIKIVEYPYVTEQWWTRFFENSGDGFSIMAADQNVLTDIYREVYRRIRMMNPMQSRTDYIRIE